MARMVLTRVVPMSEAGLDRRRVLSVAAAAGLSVTLSGCSIFHKDGPAPAPTTDVLRPLLTEAVALAAAYDRAVVAQPGLSTRLKPLADDHRDHAAELAKVIGVTVPSAAATS